MLRRSKFYRYYNWAFQSVSGSITWKRGIVLAWDSPFCFIMVMCWLVCFDVHIMGVRSERIEEWGNGIYSDEEFWVLMFGWGSWRNYFEVNNFFKWGRIWVEHCWFFGDCGVVWEPEICLDKFFLEINILKVVILNVLKVERGYIYAASTLHIPANLLSKILNS